MHPAALPVAALLKQVVETRTKRSGPGGQHRNKTQTAVILVHAPTGVSAEGSERRSQVENRAAALRRLRLRLALECRHPVSPAGPSALWKARTRGRRLVIAASHEDYASLLAEALDRLHDSGFEIPRAAEALGISGSQLVRFLQKSPAAWTAVNQRRAALGLPPLKP